MFDLSNNEDKIKFGERIRNARIKKGKEYTQEKVAELIGVQRSTYALWETGAKIPHWESLSKICEVLDIDTGYLLGLYDENNYDIRKIKEITGLSEKAIEKLKSELQFACLSFFMDNENFSKALKILWTMPIELAFIAENIKDDSDMQSIDLDTLKECRQINENWSIAQRYMASAIDDYIDNAEKKCGYPQKLKHTNFDWIMAKRRLK